MSITLAEKIFLGITLTGFSGMAIWLGIALHFAHTEMDVMLAHLRNCPFVMNRALFHKTGVWGRLFVLGGIASVLMYPSVYLKDGGAVAGDLESFPAKLKRKTVILFRINLALLAYMFGAGGVAYLYI